MENSKVCKPDWELLVGMGLVFEDQAMTRTIHWLEARGLHLTSWCFILKKEKIFFVVLVMTRNLP